MPPRSIFITGASSGLGRGLALHYAKDGATVHAAGRRAQEIEILAREAPPGHVVPVVLDVSDPVRLVQAIRDAESAAGGALDRLVANAGMGATTNLRKMDWAKVRKILHLSFPAASLPIA